MNRYDSTRNFGCGKTMAYADRRALRETYKGHYATVAAHAVRWRLFSRWAKTQGIRDAQDITTATLVRYGSELGEQVAQKAMAVSYAQNLVSTANVVLEILRMDRTVRVSPSKIIGAKRSNIRTEPPLAMSRETVEKTVSELQGNGFVRQAVVLQMARDCGVRAKEAVLMDYHEALRTTERDGAINVTNGTKGGRGREVDRWVPVPSQAIHTLRRGLALQQKLGGRNLIAKDEDWKTVNNALRTVPVRHTLQVSGLKMYHDARAAYACERYHAITGHPAPAVAGIREADKAVDRSAREVIGCELGHGRIDILVSYVGSSK